MAWKDKLQPASFRGVPFEVTGDDGTFGCRVQVHEYPQRDKPHTEDLGRAAREISLTAFLIGDDYLDKRDRLLDALEKGGPGELVHPWYGRKTVVLKDPAKVSHNISSGGMCEVQMTFVEAGELAFPSATDSLGAQSLLSADFLEAASIDDFVKNFSVDGLPSFVSEEGLKTLTSGFSKVESGIGFARSILNDPLSLVSKVADYFLPDGASMASSLFGLFKRGASVIESLIGVFGGGGAHTRNTEAVRALIRTTATLQPSTLIGGQSTYRTQVAKNDQAINDLMRRVLLVQAAGMTTVMPLPVYDDAVKLRNELSNALDTESLTASDDMYRALQDLRAKVHADVSARLESAARVVIVVPKDVLPGLVLAYDQYEDVQREIEIIETNKIRHPGFTPVKPLRMLSE